MEPAASASSSSGPESRRAEPEAAELRLRRRTLETVLEQCQRALELMREADGSPGDGTPEAGDRDEGGAEGTGDVSDGEGPPTTPPSEADFETDEVRGISILWPGVVIRRRLGNSGSSDCWWFS
jgi:hypothetical protein